MGALFNMSNITWARSLLALLLAAYGLQLTDRCPTWLYMDIILFFN
nr:MAG TPA: hypothetical protein [Caudoviricetes sp.]